MFDYGTPEPIGGEQDHFKVWPTEGTRTALLDADSIAYVIGYTSTLQDYLKAKRAPVFEDTLVWNEKIQHASYLINKWVTDAGCDSALLYLTDGANNFRLKLSDTYKGQRVEEKPPFFYEMRSWLTNVHAAIMSVNCEADDMISIEAWKRILSFDSELWSSGHKKFSNFVVVSGDKDLGIIPTWRCPPGGVLSWTDRLGELTPVWKSKDVMDYQYWPTFDGRPKNIKFCEAAIKYQGKIQIKGFDALVCPKDKWEMDYIWHFESYKQDTFTRGANAGKGKFKRVQVGTKASEYLHKLKGTGLKFFYSQLLTGDAVDNYPGLPGCGSTVAYNVLYDAPTEDELIARVRQLYFNKYGEAGDARLTEQGQLAHMQTKEGELWQIPSCGKSTFPA